MINLNLMSKTRLTLFGGNGGFSEHSTPGVRQLCLTLHFSTATGARKVKVSHDMHQDILYFNQSLENCLSGQSMLL